MGGGFRQVLANYQSKVIRPDQVPIQIFTFADLSVQQPPLMAKGPLRVGDTSNPQALLGLRGNAQEVLKRLSLLNRLRGYDARRQCCKPALGVV